MVKAPSSVPIKKKEKGKGKRRGGGERKGGKKRGLSLRPSCSSRVVPVLLVGSLAFNGWAISLAQEGFLQGYGHQEVRARLTLSLFWFIKQHLPFSIAYPLGGNYLPSSLLFSNALPTRLTMSVRHLAEIQTIGQDKVKAVSSSQGPANRVLTLCEEWWVMGALSDVWMDGHSRSFLPEHLTVLTCGRGASLQKTALLFSEKTFSLSRQLALTFWV